LVYKLLHGFIGTVIKGNTCVEYCGVYITYGGLCGICVSKFKQFLGFYSWHRLIPN